MGYQNFTFVTDTATLCIFDLACLKHRLDSEPDWWVYPPEVELTELVSGNVAFLGLGGDGKYSGTVQDTPLREIQVQFQLHTPSHRLFIGAGEEVTSDGLEPECVRGGLFVSVESAVSSIQVSRGKYGEIQVAVLPHSGPIKNVFVNPLRLD
jgi:hypothetical protein